MASHIPSDINGNFNLVKILIINNSFAIFFFFKFFIFTELRTAFILMDSDGDGRVTAVEVQTMLERLGIILREDIVFNLVRAASQTGKQ